MNIQGAVSVAPFFKTGVHMPVSNEHLANKVQTWDGLSFAVMDAKEARKLEKEGVLQIATNTQGKDLKDAAYFNKARESKKPAATLPGMTPKKKTYKTRQMKAEK